MLKLRQLPLALAIAAATSQVNAAGFAINEHSAAGLGRANAGEAAIADDASTISHNPAGLTRIKTNTVTGALAYVDPTVKIDGPTDSLSSSSSAPSAVVPAGYFAAPINDKLVLGLGMYSDFGFKTDYDKDFGALASADVSDIVAYYLTGSMGYKVTDQLSLGLGISVVHATAELSSALPGGEVNLMQLEGDDTTYGWNVGALYEFNEATRVGLSYKSEVKLSFDGDIKSDFIPAWNAGGSADLDLPAMLELAGYHDINDQFAVHASIQRTYWSSFEELAIKVDNNGGTQVPVVIEDYQDVMRYSVGATYTLNPEWTLRAGIAYDETPSTDEHRTLRLPDSSRVLYSVGATWNVSDKMNIDAGYQYVDGETSSIEEPTSPIAPNDTTFSATNSAHILSVGGSYKF
ncbi:47 kDa outer membrane protein [Sinobacterium norvegicum]|uniref:47 kDa outer membrane protein n=1 Tax=Sinobacterium norvegicum TaxID=1641715 RepID=A0ABM9ABZ5_9GAMM|nr:outer membrane protein transport protein [Sinobacterium norvegicum]CAH0990427.1 47 kDa outer membrane protein [Sinobacterium norvegicum]